MEINRCPRCGQAPKVESYNQFGTLYITIKCCDIRKSFRGYSLDKAAEGWNEFIKKEVKNEKSQ